MASIITANRPKSKPAEGTFRRAFRSPGQQRQVPVRDEVGHAVDDRDLIHAVLTGVPGGGVAVIAEVQQVDFFEVQGQEGGQGVGVGVPDQQQLPGSLWVLDDA